MRFTAVACAAALTAVVYANPSPANANAASNSAAADSTTLNPAAIQSGSANNGLQETGSEAGEAASLTSNNNFINNCVGKTLTNGLQIVTGSCNSIPMGDIPAKTSMVSSVILFPTTGGQDIQSDTTFNISVQVANLDAGFFTNADATYYAAPQALNNGIVVGHTHVTVQDMGPNFNPTQPLDATQFSFFKGINDAGNGKGLLQAVVTGGLPAGNYRVCTLTSAANHQPVLMPVAQRGSQDDCTKFTVSGSGTTINTAANNGSGGQAAAAAAAAAVSLGPDVNTNTIAAAASATSAAANAKGGNANASAAASATSAAANAKGGNANAATKAASGKAAATGAAANGKTNAQANTSKQGGAAAAAKTGQQSKAGGKLRARREFIA